MTTPKPIKAGKYQDYLEETKGIERDLVAEVLRSRRVAWVVAGFFGFLTVVALVAAAFAFSEERPDPVVLRVDNVTGNVEVVSHLEAQLSYEEVTDLYWLNQYMVNRESYDYDTIQSTYDTTALLSADSVQREYFAIYKGDEALDVVLSNRVRVDVEVRSIEPNNAGQATIRFSTQRKHRNGVKESKQHWVAHVAYEYVNTPMSLLDRRKNPLGFQVTSYRKYPEVVSQ